MNCTQKDVYLNAAQARLYHKAHPQYGVYALSPAELLKSISYLSMIVITRCLTRHAAQTTEQTYYFTALLQKLTGSQPVKKLPAFYGTRKFIAAFTKTHHLSLIISQIDPVRVPPSHFLKIILNVIPHLRLGLPSGLFPLGFHTKTLYASLFSPIYATCPAHLILNQ